MGLLKTGWCGLSAGALIAACASGSSLPDGYGGPQATIVDTAVQKGPSQIHLFEIEKVDGRDIHTSELETAGRNQGRGAQITPVALSHPVAARPARFTVSGATIYASPILALVNPACNVEGDIEFTPLEGHTYSVTGHLGPDGCGVWIQEAATAQIVGQKVSGRGIH